VLPFGDLLRPAEERLKERGPVDGSERLRMRKRILRAYISAVPREKKKKLKKIDQLIKLISRFHDFVRNFMSIIRIAVAPISSELFPSCSSGRVSTLFSAAALGRDSFLSGRSLSRLIIPLA